MDVFIKRPDEVLDYDALFAKWLPTGDSIQSAAAIFSSLTPATSTLAIGTITPSSNAVKVWLSAGADGDDAVVKVTAVTVGGRTKDHAFRIHVKGP